MSYFSCLYDCALFYVIYGIIYKFQIILEFIICCCCRCRVVYINLKAFSASLNLTRHPHLSLWVFSPILYAIITIILFNQQFQMIEEEEEAAENKTFKLSDFFEWWYVCKHDNKLSFGAFFWAAIENANIIPIRSVRSFVPTVRSLVRLLAWSFVRSLVSSFIHSFVCLFICGSISVVHFQLPLQYTYIFISKRKQKIDLNRASAYFMSWLDCQLKHLWSFCCYR